MFFNATRNRPSGSGKTIMGLHFIYGGAQRGERGIIATLQENPTLLITYETSGLLAAGSLSDFAVSHLADTAAHAAPPHGGKQA